MGYLGSKAASGAFQSVIASMPPHDVYIEAFLGSGVVMRNKPPASRSIGVDLNRAALDAFSAPYPVELLEADALSTIAGFDYAGSRVLIYADPPYLHSTRTSRARYAYEMSESDHVRLSEVLNSVSASVILSGYPSPLYDELFSGWRTCEFQVMTRGGPRTEKLWMNFEGGAFWSSFAGKNFTDRQRIKRKADRWAANYRSLSSGERLAVLSSLLNVHGDDLP